MAPMASAPAGAERRYRCVRCGAVARELYRRIGQVYRHVLFNRLEAAVLAREASRFLLLCFLLDAHACWSTMRGSATAGVEPTMFGWLRQAAGDWAVVGATFAETAVYMLTLSLAAAIFQPKLSELASLSWHARIWEAISVSSFGKIYTLVPTIWSSFSSDAGAVDQAIAVALSFFVALANVLALRTVLEDRDYKRAAVAVTLAYIARAVSRHLLQTQT
ncbi:hypothetical protein AK812_SmicGene24252 [Symbiodinium microadriaticum]|uniref:Protein ARV n=1 Tax=Symbiodinium microadriaticum TaxID=2951 RepID=A0A1Q9DF96_SYMMI|nr:hypothetical protein AK812_SmicGene24252 [Symbiodinium microadriaticum]